MKKQHSVSSKTNERKLLKMMKGSQDLSAGDTGMKK